MSHYYCCARCGEESSVRYSPVAMRADLKERLEAKGWTVSDWREFVGEIICPPCAQKAENAVIALTKLRTTMTKEELAAIRARNEERKTDWIDDAQPFQQDLTLAITDIDALLAEVEQLQDFAAVVDEQSGDMPMKLGSATVPARWRERAAA